MNHILHGRDAAEDGRAHLIQRIPIALIIQRAMEQEDDRSTDQQQELLRGYMCMRCLRGKLGDAENRMAVARCWTEEGRVV